MDHNPAVVGVFRSLLGTPGSVSNATPTLEVLKELDRGGLTQKLHVVVDRRGRLLKLLVTAAQRGEASQLQGLIEELKPGTVKHVLADAAMPSANECDA